MLLQVAGIDPSFRNFGIAKMKLDISQPKFVLTCDELRLKQTEKDGAKSVRRNSDDLRRAQELHSFFQAEVHGSKVIFAEVPHGSQSAASMKSMGICIGILASAPIPVIQVQAHETKLATVGTRTASKEEMIEWGLEKYPNANWLRAHGKKDGKVVAANEHLADALAVVHAGVETNQFKQLLSVLKVSAFP